jgi:NDP-sugar pyrophosphorylase family protein
MKVLLICPGDREPLAALAEPAPLSNIPLFGKSLVEHWIEHSITLGAKEIHVLACDRPQEVAALAGTGARWGVQVTVHSEIRELTPADARKKYRNKTDPWLPEPHDVVVMDHLPAHPNLPLLTSFADWFMAAVAMLPSTATPDRIGLREIQPGVWVGLHTQIAPDAELRAPCWIGEHVRVGEGAIIGPMAIVENATFIEPSAEIAHSYVGPETLVGKCTEIHHSLAWGNTLIDWKSNSHVKVTDAFLLCSLAKNRATAAAEHRAGRISAALSILLPHAREQFSRFEAPLLKHDGLSDHGNPAS